MTNTTNIYEETPDMDTTGGRISRAREASGLSVKEVAWQLGVKMATVNAWESDRSQPGSHRLNGLAGLLNVSISWILHGVGTAPAEPDRQGAMDSVATQLEKLKLLHRETGHLIKRIQKDLDTIGATY